MRPLYLRVLLNYNSNEKQADGFDRLQILAGLQKRSNAIFRILQIGVAGLQCRRYGEARGAVSPLTAACAPPSILVHSKHYFWNITQAQDNRQ